MQEHKQLPQSALRYIDGSPRSFLERVQDLWFAPKRFESTALYERLGVLLVKKYVPTGGDFFIRRYGIRIVDVRGGLDSLIHFERYTRRLEAIHEIVFLGFVGFSLWRAIVHQTTLVDFGFAIVVYIVLILSPAMLQRYNRLRVYPVIRRLASARSSTSHTSACATLYIFWLPYRPSMSIGQIVQMRNAGHRPIALPPIVRPTRRPSARVVDAACPGAGDSDPGCRRRRNSAAPISGCQPRSRPAHATTRRKGRAERRAGLAVAGQGHGGVPSGRSAGTGRIRQQLSALPVRPAGAPRRVRFPASARPTVGARGDVDRCGGPVRVRLPSSGGFPHVLLLGCGKGARPIGPAFPPHRVDNPHPHIGQGANRHRVALPSHAFSLV